MPSPKFAPLEAVVLPDLPPPRRSWPRWLLVCGVLALFLGLMSAALWGVGRLATGLRAGGANSDSLVETWETPAKRLQNIAAAMNAAEVGASPGELRALQRILSRVSAASQQGDTDAYLACFDLNSLIRRISRHPVARNDRSLTMWTLKTELQTSLETPTGLGEFSIVRVERGPRDDQVLVYAVESDYFQTAAFRWWLVRSGRNWRVCDYERLDHGQSLAAGWAIRGEIDRDSSKYNYYNLQSALNQPAYGNYRPSVSYPSAGSPLDPYLSLPLPAVARDVSLLDLAWALIGERRPTAALAACDKVERVDENPGVLLARAKAWQMLGKNAKALAAASQYQQIVGRDPHALTIEANAHEALENHVAAATKWGELLDLYPEHSHALDAFCRLANNEQRRRVPELVARCRQPLEAAAAQAQSAINRDDGETYDALVKFIAERASNSPELDALAAARLTNEGKHEAAAALFLKASQAEWLPEKKQQHFNGYLAAMTEAKQAVAAYEQATDHDAAFAYLTDGFEEEESLIPAEQLGPLIVAHRMKKGDSFTLDYLEGLLLLREKKYAEAEAKFSSAANQTRDEYELEMCRDRRIEALVAKGTGMQAYGQFGPTSDVFQAVAREFQSRHEWDNLRRLIDAHRYNVPGDIWIDYFLAIEQQGRGDYREALASIRRAEQGSDESLKSYCQWIKTEIALQAGEALAVYSESQDRETAFANLANRLAQEEDWQHLEKLVQLHPADATSPTIIEWATRGPFALGDYEQVVGRLHPWPNFPATTEPAEMEVLHERLVRSLLRLGRKDEARQAAERARDQLEFELPLVMVLLAEGRFPELTEKLADKRLLKSVQSQSLADDPELRQLMLTTELAEFRAANVWPFPSRFVESLGHITLLESEPADCDLAQLQKHLTAAGIPTDAMREIPRAEGDPLTSFIVGTEFGTLLVSFGNGPAQREKEEDFRPVIADESLARLIEQHRGHTIIDFERAALESNSERIAAQAARVAAQLRGEGTLAITAAAANQQHWLAQATPDLFERLARHELLTSRQPIDVLRLNLPLLASQPPLPGDPEEDDWEARHRELRELSRQVEKGEAAPHEIAVDLWRGHVRERIWLKITGVNRGSYGQWEMVGKPDQASSLWPHLRAGLPVAVEQYEVVAIRTMAK